MDDILRARCFLNIFIYSFLVSFEAENQASPARNFAIPAPAKFLLIVVSTRLNLSVLEIEVFLYELRI